MGCGRTDTGVHARSYFVHFDSQQTLDAGLIREMNSFLPKDIAVYRFFKANILGHKGKPTHARFDAYERHYEYIINLRKDPFARFLKTELHQKNLNVDRMNAAASRLREFSNFKTLSKLDADTKDHICELYFANWKQDGHDLVFTISANRFLRSMVRKTVGTLIRIGMGKMTEEEMVDAIKSQDPERSGMMAPPDGLYLKKVFYPKDAFQELR